MKEQDIRDPDVFRKYLELSRRDAERIFSDKSTFENIACPACDSAEHTAEIHKHGFTYARCAGCETLFVNPRPHIADLQRFYGDSESTTYWVNEFFMPKAESRRQLMFRPRAQAIVERFPDFHRGRIAEIGAGFGIFLEELGKLWPEAQRLAIEPSREMARICEGKGLRVIEKMFEDLDASESGFDLLVTFELVEHLQNPFEFFLPYPPRPSSGWITFLYHAERLRPRYSIARRAFQKRIAAASSQFFQPRFDRHTLEAVRLREGVRVHSRKDRLEHRGELYRRRLRSRPVLAHLCAPCRPCGEGCLADMAARAPLEFAHASHCLLATKVRRMNPSAR